MGPMLLYARCVLVLVEVCTAFLLQDFLMVILIILLAPLAVLLRIMMPGIISSIDRSALFRM